MIREWLLLSGLARAEEPAAPPEPPPEDPLAEYRVPFDALVNRTVGSTSRPVEFDWRRKPVHLAATGSFLAELNNFNTLRAGGLVRLPTGKVLVDLGVSYVDVWDSPSSRALALTPYRQAGRPDRLEVEAGLALPIAEGVVTAAPRFFPSVQMVFEVSVGVRYLVYPVGFGHLTTKQVAGAIFAPSLTQPELDNLEGIRLDAMEVDPARYGVMVGIGDDLFFESGLFVSPRVFVAVPLLAPLTGSTLRVWPELSLAIGVAL